MTRLRLLSMLTSLGLAVACGERPVPVGTHGLVVQASVSAASLAQDCAAKATPSAGVCIGGPPCSEPCQQSNVQLELAAETGSGPVDVAVVDVRVVQSSDGKVLDHLTSRNPQTWNGSTYVSWDGQIAADTTIKISYDLSAPSWSSSDAARSSTTYRVEVDLRIDGVVRTLSLEGVTREPLIST